MTSESCPLSSQARGGTIHTHSNIKGWKRAIKEDTPRQSLASMLVHKHTQYKIILKGCGDTNLFSQ